VHLGLAVGNFLPGTTQAAGKILAQFQFTKRRWQYRLFTVRAQITGRPVSWARLDTSSHQQHLI
jgi:hypothetical protein